MYMYMYVAPTIDHLKQIDLDGDNPRITCLPAQRSNPRFNPSIVRIRGMCIAYVHNKYVHTCTCIESIAPVIVLLCS